MKTEGFILAIGLLISVSLTAQTKQELSADSVRIGYNLSQKMLSDTLRLENPFTENNLQSHSFRYRFPKPEQNLAQIYRFGKAYQPTDKMPIARPDFNSKMPVVKPDSSVHYFIQIIKIGN